MKHPQGVRAAVTLRTALVLLSCIAATAARGALPDWSGQWEVVGETPSASGGSLESVEQVLKTMDWNPAPSVPAVKKIIEQYAAEERRHSAVVRSGGQPDTVTHARCSFGVPMLMIESPLMFEILATPKETVLIFSGREVRHVYTDGRPHTPKEDLWPTPWGDSIGHWDGQTLIIDTIEVGPATYDPGPPVVAVFAWGGDSDEEGEVVGLLSQDAHYVERIRMVDKNHLEDRMTITDPQMLTGSWTLVRTYQRVQRLHRMVHEDCEGEDRNPIVKGQYTLTPPPPPTQPPPRPDGSDAQK